MTTKERKDLKKQVAALGYELWHRDDERPFYRARKGNHEVWAASAEKLLARIASANG